MLRCDPAEPEDEICDALDNDCDGETDEGAPGDGEPCDTGELGVCAAGIGDCTLGVFTCVQREQPADEECCGLDDDCDGETDEGSPGDGEECDTGQDGVCAPGVGRCVRGVLLCDRLVEPSEEVCDGLDNDCNDEVDDDAAEHDEPCELEQPEGECAFGRGRCEDGELYCDVYEPVPEVCDWLDNDCDGLVDEDDGQGDCIDEDRFWRCADLDGPHEVWKMEPHPDNVGLTCGDLCREVGAPGCVGRTGNSNDARNCNSGSGHDPVARNCNTANRNGYWEWCYCMPR